MRPTRAVIHLNAILHNADCVRHQLPSATHICAAVKANGYGHGAVRTAQALQSRGIHSVGVAVPEEGIVLRDAGYRGEILLFSPFFPNEATDIAVHELTPMVFDSERIKALQSAAANTEKTIKVFLKIDTGMGRIGCPPHEAVPLAQMIKSAPNLTQTGTATHFAAADNRDTAFAHSQLTLFLQSVKQLRAHNIECGRLSTANSGAVIAFPDSAGLDLARPGIMLYGYFPSSEIIRNQPLIPAMTLESAVSLIKRVPAGSPVSYGMTYTTTHETEIATIPVGYADGVFRALSNRGRVWINGKTYPIVGRICMDQFMVDLGLNSGIQLYDRVVLFGPPQHAADGTDSQETPPTAEDIAELCSTIPYEIICAVSNRIPRVYQDTPLCPPCTSAAAAANR